MKKAKEYIKKYENTIYSIEDIIKIAQKDAIKATLELAADEAFVEFIDLTSDEVFDYTDVIRDDDVEANVSKKSILSLKDELFKQLD